MTTSKSTAFEILAQQYRDWHAMTFGEENGIPAANDALETAEIARFDVAADYYPGDQMFQPGDYILVWPRGVEHGPVGSRVVMRYVGWAPALGNELLHDVQKFAHLLEPQASLTVTVGRISATRQGPIAAAQPPSLTLRGFHGTVPYSPPCERLWPAAADVLCDELTKIRAALRAAKTLLETPKDADARSTLTRLLGDLEVA